MYCVYVHINKLNKKLYFGITKQKPTNRWGNGSGYLHSPHFFSAIKKYGWNNFEHIILADNLEEDDAKYFEKQLIAFYDTRDNNKGYNIDEGGDCNLRSEETKKKISQSETGKVVSEETRRKQSEAMNGYVWDREVVERRRTTYINNDHHLTDEHKDILRQRMLGNKNGCHPCAEETKQKISDKLTGNTNSSKAIICDETSEEWSGMKICVDDLGVSMHILRKAVNDGKDINGLHYKRK